MNNRPIYTSDLPALQAAITADTFHPGEWKVEDFKGFSEVFEDSHGLITFAVYHPEGERLRISTMWCTPEDTHRNGRAIIFLVRKVSERAAEAGFRELVFSTKYDRLARFCCNALGFVSAGNTQYVLFLKGNDYVRP